MRLSCLTAAILGDALFSAVRPVVASDALWIQPSGNWLGIDGDWSTFGFSVGAPLQHVELTVSTALSEIWVVESSGCSPNILCYNARGGVFSPGASKSFQSLGPWELGLKDLPYGGNGDYGLDSIAFTDTLNGKTTSVNSALIAAINDTDYYQGYIGVGVAQGRFGRNVTNPFLTQLVETYGFIPSHSYGYTAGANYAGKMPGSLTLGGYDANRLKPHDVNFHLNPNDRIPSVNLRGITATVPTLESAPASKWTSTSQPLLGMNESVTAVVDTSTPYLWLPAAVCDRFAKYLNLQWNETLGVYVFSEGSQYTDYLQQSPLSFTFSISSYDYLDNFAQPLALPGVVNITIPAAAFAQLLRYPFANVIKFSDSSIPYFPLKRAAAGGPYIIGRAFMQAAYMIMNYETAQFSIHEAVFPSNPDNNISLVTIDGAPTSPYPKYVPPVQSKGLTIAQIAGMVVGIVLVGSIVLITTYICCRRRRTRKANKQAAQVEEAKDDSESVDSDQPRSPVRRMLSVIIRRKKSRKPVVHEVHGHDRQLVEVAADASHEVYELPVPPEPVELDSTEGTDEVTELGTESSRGLTPYELARRKLERQLQGPVPTYTPPPPEKMGQDISPVPHYRPSDEHEPSPASSPTYANTNSLPNSLPSPMSPHPMDWTNRHFDLPSPLTVAPPFPSPHFPGTNSDPSATYSTGSPQSPTSPHSLHSRPSIPEVSVSRSNSANVSPISPIIPPSPTYQRTPIDPARVICLGPLPENVQLPRHHPTIPRLILPDGRALDPRPRSGSPTTNLPIQPPHSGHHRRRSTSTLGSNYTVDEEIHIQNNISRDDSLRHQHDEAPQEEQSDDYPRSPRSMERIDGGSELVHVPQLADKRYSWEDDHR
ncbi:acid protease [Coniochaeta ligniaria NRRL 30616]|uniref:Acid protease n=1 Tax=Coniochaeta ligniaria NRRL 30616 TaxID=1408157 RepID=A0A1J7JL85_9PEZI|nr:acid protease [Coniochaeta ligniaria NRRL 30616]